MRSDGGSRGRVTDVEGDDDNLPWLHSRTQQGNIRAQRPRSSAPCLLPHHQIKFKKISSGREMQTNSSINSVELRANLETASGTSKICHDDDVLSLKSLWNLLMGNFCAMWRRRALARPKLPWEKMGDDTRRDCRWQLQWYHDIKMMMETKRASRAHLAILKVNWVHFVGHSAEMKC